jgi:Ni,Fe-hydrogenase I large subunit
MAKVGRPLKFQSVQDMQVLIDNYFDETPREEWTITGLALALDMHRADLMRYQNMEEFTHTIKKAKTRIENAYEIDLKKHGRVGTIFILKNFGWTDKQEVSHSISNDLLVDDGFDEALKSSDTLSDFIDKKSLEDK